MENITAVCANDLPTILGFVQNCLKSRSVIFSQQLNFDPNSIIAFFTSQSSAQDRSFMGQSPLAQLTLT